ncbi:hypothetical protein T02_612 [Trichinella nativa]|uniref:Uncharacterized protein n=1 Tax=Trichinella nativa TaxID=6335 RepID=A0A0V1LSQ2_9BILA|nr:hypothetical protein T02_612 [Trichinella nativa]
MNTDNNKPYIFKRTVCTGKLAMKNFIQQTPDSILGRSRRKRKQTQFAHSLKSIRYIAISPFDQTNIGCTSGLDSWMGLSYSYITNASIIKSAT